MVAGFAEVAKRKGSLVAGVDLNTDFWVYELNMISDFNNL
jgi:hypothetical protein